MPSLALFLVRERRRRRGRGRRCLRPMEPTFVVRNDPVVFGRLVLHPLVFLPSTASRRVDFGRNPSSPLPSPDTAEAYFDPHDLPDTDLERSLGWSRVLAQTPLHVRKLVFLSVFALRVPRRGRPDSPSSILPFATHLVLSPTADHFGQRSRVLITRRNAPRCDGNVRNARQRRSSQE